MELRGNKEDSERRLPGLGIVLVVTLSIDRGHTCAFESVSSEGQTVCQEERSHLTKKLAPPSVHNYCRKLNVLHSMRGKWDENVLRILCSWDVWAVLNTMRR